MAQSRPPAGLQLAGSAGHGTPLGHPVAWAMQRAPAQREGGWCIGWWLPIGLPVLARAVT
eukprot:1160632-Pelagomonas_calceolata.AAC.12